MEHTPLLSVITPISNMAGKLARLELWLSTILKSDSEVILIHDITDEMTGLELERLFQKHKDGNIQLLQGRFGGPGSARNAGIEMAKGRWISFWDSDDEPNVNNFLKVVEKANSTTCEIIVGGFITRNERTNQERKEELFSNNLAENLDRVSFNPGIWRMAFRRSFLGGNRFPSSRMGEDQLLLANLNFYNSKIDFYNDSVYCYITGNPNQLTANSSAISDLKKVAKTFLQKISLTPKSESKYLAIMFIRQCLTLLKRGRFDARLLSIWLLLRYFFLALIGRVKVVSPSLTIFKSVQKIRLGVK
jgi:glycosyltransferase involved in cell wall biosynthesis